MKNGSRVGRLVGFGCGLMFLAIGALVFLAKPLALSISDAVVLEKLRDDISLSVEPPEEVQAGEVFTLTIMMHNEEEYPVEHGELLIGLHSAQEVRIRTCKPFLTAFSSS